jgi:hypothetical protein
VRRRTRKDERPLQRCLAVCSGAASKTVGGDASEGVGFTRTVVDPAAAACTTQSMPRVPAAAMMLEPSLVWRSVRQHHFNSFEVGSITELETNRRTKGKE